MLDTRCNKMHTKILNCNFFYLILFYHRKGIKDNPLPIKDKLLITFTYLVSTVVSYMLMLVVMSFNGGLFLATIFGLTIGNAIFSNLKKKDNQTSD